MGLMSTADSSRCSRSTLQAEPTPGYNFANISFHACGALRKRLLSKGKETTLSLAIFVGQTVELDLNLKAFTGIEAKELRVVIVKGAKIDPDSGGLTECRSSQGRQG